MTGIYHKLTRLRWHAVSFAGPSQDPFIIATRNKQQAILLAKTLFPCTEEVVVDRVEIRRAANTPKSVPQQHADLYP